MISTVSWSEICVILVEEMPTRFHLSVLARKFGNSRAIETIPAQSTCQASSPRKAKQKASKKPDLQTVRAISMCGSLNMLRTHNKYNRKNQPESRRVRRSLNNFHVQLYWGDTGKNFVFGITIWYEIFFF